MAIKKETLKKLGAELIEVDAVPYANHKNYIKESKKIAEEIYPLLKRIIKEKLKNNICL